MWIGARPGWPWNGRAVVIRIPGERPASVPLRGLERVVLRSGTHIATSLLAELEALIHPAHDDVRAYRLPPELWHRAIGAPALPRGLLAALEGQQVTVAGGDE